MSVFQLKNTSIMGGRNCPSCGGRIWRLSDDKFLTCHRCGWTVSYPFLRWVTHPTWLKYYIHRGRNYPVSTIWSVSKVVIVLLVAGLLLAATAPIGGVIDALESAAAGGSNSPSDNGVVEEGYNLNRTEELFIQYLNQERASRDLQNVSQRDILTQMGRNHSRNMADHDYIGHKEPDGDTIEDRYQQNGLLPECRLPISGSDRYYAGAENVVGAWVNQEFEAWETGEIIYIDSEKELARYLFKTWMRSEPHRNAMLVSSANEAGLGVYIDVRGKVYASLELC